MAERPLSRGRGPRPPDPAKADPDAQEYADFFDEDGNPTDDPAKIRSGYIMTRTPGGGWEHRYVTNEPDAEAAKPSSGRVVKRR